MTTDFLFLRLSNSACLPSVPRPSVSEYPLSASTLGPFPDEEISKVTYNWTILKCYLNHNTTKYVENARHHKDSIEVQT